MCVQDIQTTHLRRHKRACNSRKVECSLDNNLISLNVFKTDKINIEERTSNYSRENIRIITNNNPVQKDFN